MTVDAGSPIGADDTPRRPLVAVMQPYFLPYAGYFRLFAAADIFVFLDCVQFPRRGWVHRNRFRTASDHLDWLTLPLAKAPQSVAIRDLRFRPGAGDDLARQMRRFPVFERPKPGLRDLFAAIGACEGDVTDVLVDLTLRCCELLDLSPKVYRSSGFDLDPSLRSSERIRAIVKAVGGGAYVNSPGGRELYDQEDFARDGIDLSFLSDWSGSFDSIAQRLQDEDISAVAQDIRRQTVLER